MEAKTTNKTNEMPMVLDCEMVSVRVTLATFNEGVKKYGDAYSFCNDAINEKVGNLGWCSSGYDAESFEEAKNIASVSAYYDEACECTLVEISMVHYEDESIACDIYPMDISSIPTTEFEKEDENRLIKAVNNYFGRKGFDGELDGIEGRYFIDLGYTTYECGDGEEHEAQVSFDLDNMCMVATIDGKHSKYGDVMTVVELTEFIDGADFNDVMRDAMDYAYELYGEPKEE